MRKIIIFLLGLLLISYASAINITTFNNNQESIKSDENFNQTFSIPQGSHVSLAQLDLTGEVTQNLTSDINVTYVATVLSPVDLDLIPGTSNFFVVDKYDRVYKVNSTFGLIKNITINSTCGDLFVLPYTDHDYYGVSAISDDIVYILHRGLDDSESLLIKLNFTTGNDGGCLDYWQFSTKETIVDAEDVYVDDNEEYAYVTQGITGTNKIYTLNISDCDDDCWSGVGTWTIDSTVADRYSSIDSDDDGDHFWVTSTIYDQLYYINSTYDVLETYDLDYISPYDGLPLQDDLGHSVNHTTHWILDTETKDEMATIEIKFPEDIVITINTTPVFNNTGFLRYTNTSINLSPSLFQDVLTTQNSVFMQIAGSSFGNLTADNLLISYEPIFECDGDSSEVVVYNFTLTDEDNSSVLAGDLVVDLVYNNTILSYYANDTSSIAICMAQDANYTVYGFVQGDVGYLNKYFFANALFNSNNPQEIDFYNKGDITDYSDLVLTVRDESYLPFPYIIGKVERYYPAEHLWKSVQQDISDSFGQQFFTIKEKDIEYRIYFYRNSTLLDNTQVVKFICDSGLCQASFQVLESAEDTSDLGITTLYDNSTGILNVSWNDGSGSTSSVRITVSKDTLTGTQNICNASVSSPFGTYSCNTSLYTGEVVVNVYSPSTFRVPTFFTYLSLDSTQLSDFLAVADYALYSFALLIVFAGMGSVSPVASVITTVFGIFMISVFGLNPIVNIPFVILVSVLGTLIGVKLKS